MSARRVLVVHPTLDGDGGGDQVAAWVLEALCRDYEVTLLTSSPVDFAAVDAFCETQLDGAEIAVELTSRSLEALLSRVPMRLALLRVAQLVRAVRRLDRNDRFDCIVSTFNEMDLGRPGIQYVHYPWSLLPRPAWEDHWYTRLPGAPGLYHELVRRVAGFSNDRMRRNWSLANSRFVADLVESLVGSPCTVLYPPAPGTFHPGAWASRRSEIVCLGRISPEKRVEEVIAIVRGVRSRGQDLSLRLIGLPGPPDYVAKIQEQVAADPDWITLELGVSRESLLEGLHQARFGIHAMREEHFGIAVAEMLRAGCVVFAHDSGGPAEILDGVEDVLFSDAEDAVNKIAALLSGERELQMIRSRMQARAGLFTAERFTEAVRDTVGRFIADHQTSADA